MADLITWGKISFYANGSEIRGVKDISIKAGAETENKTQSSETFVKKKNAGSYEISLTAVLNAALGVDVQAVAMSIAEAARKGSTGYFYTAAGKLFPSKFMAVDATIDNIRMNSKGVWTYCEVQWSLKQCSKYDGTTTGATKSSGGSSGKATSGSKKTSITTKKTTTTAASANQSPWEKVYGLVNSAISGAMSTLSAAKAASNKAAANVTRVAKITPM